jgi:aerobic-type carbon monoxide dehydrogenase small subunit (CoxS/CutS family)
LRNTSEGVVMHPMLDHMSTSKSSGHGWDPLDRFEAVSAVRTVEARIIQVDGKQVLTIEALAEGGVLLPFQEAFRGHQCGFCTPGMLITAHAFLLEQPAPTAELVRDVISGNICRCKGYIGIVEAILEASRHLREAS